MNDFSSSFPKTKEDAVNRIISILPNKDIEAIRTTPKENLNMFHFNLGIFIRNELGLWKGNKELMEDCYGEPCYYYDADQISGIIIDGIWERLQGIDKRKKFLK